MVNTAQPSTARTKTIITCFRESPPSGSTVRMPKCPTRFGGRNHHKRSVISVLCIGICDDNYDARLTLRAALERILEPRGETARILEFSSGEGLLGWKKNHPGELNLIFLDMEMGQLDGMETARRLRQGDEDLNWSLSPATRIMFLTAIAWELWGICSSL